MKDIVSFINEKDEKKMSSSDYLEKKKKQQQALSRASAGLFLGASATAQKNPAIGLALVGAGIATGIGKMINGIKGKKEYDKMATKEKEEFDQKQIDKSIAVAKKKAAKMNDEKDKKQSEDTIAAINGTLYDENGKRRSPKETQEIMKKEMGDDYDKIMKDAKESAKKTNPEDLNSITDDELKKSQEEDKKSAIDYHKKKKEKQEKDKEDSNSEPEKDEEGNTLSQEEITDKDGKKKKVTMHTGPRGGRFYYPDGAPKDEKHKVYVGKDGKVKESLYSLADFIHESITY